jgi:hypothetical protein
MKLIGEDVAIDLAFLPIGEHFVGNMFGDILSDETAMLSGSIACSVQPRWTRTAKGCSNRVGTREMGDAVLRVL